MTSAKFHFFAAKRKKRVYSSRECPFPVPVASLTGVSSSAQGWHYYTAELLGNSVRVRHTGDMDCLYSMGFFGKGTLSRGKPLHNNQNSRGIGGCGTAGDRQLKVLSRRRYLRHLAWSKQHETQKRHSQSTVVEKDSDEVVDDIDDWLPIKKKTRKDKDLVSQALGLVDKPTEILDTSEGEGQSETDDDEESWESIDGTQEGGCETQTADVWAMTTTEESEAFWETSDMEEVSPSKQGSDVFMMDRESGCRDISGGDGTSLRSADEVVIANKYSAEQLTGDHYTVGHTIRLPVPDGTNTDTRPESKISSGADTAQDLNFDKISGIDSSKEQVEVQVGSSSIPSQNEKNIKLYPNSENNVMSPLLYSGSEEYKTTKQLSESTSLDIIPGVRKNTSNNIAIDSVTDLQGHGHVSDQGHVSEPSSVDMNDLESGHDMRWTRNDYDNTDSRCLSDNDDGDVFVVDDTDDSDADVTDSIRPRWRSAIKNDPCPVHESLQLTLEETFFLAYGLGCLVVRDESQKALTLTEMWRRFCRAQRHFLPRYIVYHNLRSKGWVPKPGLKYGADFEIANKNSKLRNRFLNYLFNDTKPLYIVVYKMGPAFYHSSYSVMVKPVMEDDLLDDPDYPPRTFNWTDLARVNRITEQVNKEIMFCYVIRPNALREEELLSPNCISKFKIQEIVLRRWVSAHERENAEFILIP